MVKKFEEWRNGLTYEKANATLMSVLMIILVIGIVFGVTQLQLQPIEEIIQYVLIVGISILIFEIEIWLFLGRFLQVDAKKEKLKRQELRKIYSETFKKKTEIEIKYKGKEAPAGDAGEFYWDMKHCEEPHFWAQWQEEEENIYLELKDGVEHVRNWTISNIHFFDRYFDI